MRIPNRSGHVMGWMRMKRDYSIMRQELKMNDNAESNKKPTLFISYCQKDGNSYADDLESQLNDYFEVRRDKTKLIPNDDIYEFMAGIANEDFVLIVLTAEYVKSRNCMLEMAYLSKQDDWSDKTMVLVIDETIYKTNRKLEILTYWKLRKEKADIFIDDGSVGKKILQQEKEYLDDINESLENILFGISRRLNPSQIAVVNELVRKLRKGEAKTNPAVAKGEEAVKEFLKENGSKTMAEISENLGMSKASTTRLLRRLMDEAELESITGSGGRRLYGIRGF